MWSLPSGSQLYPREGPAGPSVLPHTDAQEPTGAAATTMCLTLNISACTTTPLAPGPGFCPHLQQGKLRRDKQAYLLDNLAACPGHLAAGTVIPQQEDCVQLRHTMSSPH